MLGVLRLRENVSQAKPFAPLRMTLLPLPSFPPCEQQTERCTQQQCAKQLLLVPNRDEVSPLRADFKHAHWNSSDSAAAPATLAARSLYFQPAAASSTAKTVGDLGHWNNCFIARDDGFSENTRDLGAGGKALVQ